MLTTPQLQTLKTAMLAEPSLTTAVAAGDDTTIAAFFNQADPTLADAWRTSLSLTEVLAVINWTEYIGRTQGERDAFRTMLTTGQVAPSRPNIRQGFQDIFSGPNGAITRPALTAAAKRKMTRAEKLLATGPTDGAFDLTFEGMLTPGEASLARSLP